MKELFSTYQILINEEQIKKFELYYQILSEWNKKINLTTITEYQEVLKKHFLDSCLILKEYSSEKFEKKKIIDVGTGAGFPGIPLSILLPNTKFVLVDSLNKRIDFLNKIVNSLELKNVELIHRRAEDLGRDIHYREQFDVCVSRAVAELPILLEYCTPFIKPKGYLYCYKSIKADEEMNRSKRALELLNCIIVNKKELVCEKDFIRYLIEIQKIDFTSDKYPRKSGKPKKKPL